MKSAECRSTMLAKLEEVVQPIASPGLRPQWAASQTRSRTGGGIHIRGNRIHFERGTLLRLRTVAIAAPPE